MAMITIERIVPGNSVTAQNQDHYHHVINNQNETNENSERPQNSSDVLGRSNEIYIAVRGADIIFPYNECHRYSKTHSHTSISELIQKHLEAILQILRPQDMMKMAVRLESQLSLTRTRYLLVISNETDQSCLLGIDYENEATIGLVLSIWNDMQIMLDGDGGFRITTGNRHHIFKPVSVQAMWSIFQALHLATKKSIKNNYYEGGGSHQWVIYYQNNIKSNSQCLHEWHTIVTDQSEINYNNVYEFTKPKDYKNFEEVITSKLKEVMVSVDLEQVTSKEIRTKLEAYFQRDLTDYKSYIDKEMIRIMGQLEEPSKILDYLYLGSEWNASNFEELKGKGVQKILNVTSEIDNYFPGYFDYYNIRVDDDEATNMLRHLNDTYYYIRKAKDEGVKVLVHCKKGISRSASVVVAYIMKEKSYDLNEALQYVKNQRSTIRPNPAFLEQLEIYQGMLHASNNKNSMMWKSNSDSELQTSTKDYHNNESSSMNINGKKKFLKQTRERMREIFRKAETEKENTFKFYRRKSWPPKDPNVIYRKCKENKIEKNTTTTTRTDSFCSYLHDNDKVNEEFSNFDLIKKLEIKSRVKERIEDFENKQPTSNQTKSFNLFKKNMTKNGLVSNLACQFEPKETNDISFNTSDNGGQHQQQQRLMKPPIPPINTKLSKDVIDFLLHYPNKYTINLSRCSHTLKNSEYSDHRILKRTLSYDNIIDFSSNFNKYLHSSSFSSNTSDNLLKKCKKSFPKSNISTNKNQEQSKQQQKLSSKVNLNNVATIQSQLYRTCSLPNIADEDTGNTSRKRIFYKNMFKKSSSTTTATHLKSSLDLQFIRSYQHYLNDNEGFDGFVKRRTEELENRYQSMNMLSSNSMPSSPNLTTEQYAQRKSPFININNLPGCFNNQVKLSKSFNCPTYNKKSSSPPSVESSVSVHQPQLPPVSTTKNETTNSRLLLLKMDNMKKLKKTYGKSHPLDKLNRASIS